MIDNSLINLLYDLAKGRDTETQQRIRVEISKLKKINMQDLANYRSMINEMEKKQKKDSQKPNGLAVTHGEGVKAYTGITT